MKTKLLFTLAGIFLMTIGLCASTFDDEGLEQEMQNETQFANGKVLTVKVLSQSIANNMFGDSEYRKVSVYLPPGYNQNGNSNYPVIYMLSDFNGTNEDWSRLSGSFTELLDQAIKSGKAKPMIMVFPDGKNKVGGGWYTNSPVAGNWEDFVVTDLVKYIDQNYRTIPFAVSRGIAGKGMGGYGALKLATKHPDVFGAVYSLNALVDFETIISHEYLWKNSFMVASKEKKYPTSDAFANQLLGMAIAFSPDMFNPLVGKMPKTESGEVLADVLQQWLDHDPLYMIQENLRKLNALKAISIDCSTSDAGIMLNSNYSEKLKSKRIKHTFTYFNGNENDAVLKRLTDVLLPMFSANLAHSLLDFKASTCYTYSDVLKATLITDGNIFIVPGETDNNLKSIQENNFIKLDVKANQENEIPFAGLKKGIYRIYGVSSTGFVDKSHTFGLNGGKPKVTVCVIDSKTGKKMDACGLKVNNKECGIIENGDFCFTADGKTTLCTQAKDYGKLEKSVMIYTDTTFVLSLVHDSYLQVVEKSYGAPVFEAMVIQNNTAKLTANNGFATVQNVKDGVLNCRIFKTGYFTEEVKIPLQPGETAVVALTPKKADVTFALVGTEGHLQDGTIKIGNLNLKPDEFGKAVFTGLDTRVEYTYTIENASYETVQNTIYIDGNTIIPVYLEPRKKSQSQLKDGQITTEINENLAREILMYPNPATNAVTVQSNNIIGFTVELKSSSGALIYTSKIEGTSHQINLSNLSNGVYFVTVKSDNFYHTRRIMKL